MDTEQREAALAYEVVRTGGVVLLPTDVGYGLIGCSDEAVAKIYELKGRPRSKACVTVANLAIMDDVARLPSPMVRSWLARISRETPIAVVNEARADSALLKGLSPFLLGQATSEGTVATFLNAGRLVTRIGELAFADRRLVLGSSANIAFTGNNYTIADVPASIRARVDLEIDHGPARYSNAERLATTMLDLRKSTFLREGINYTMIAQAWQAFQGPQACAV
jgi:tRNA A37 threonylcarbamoyladenosine synthetase subunit TsaC/SUA5/YrdC